MCLLNRCKENQFQFGVWTKAGRSGSGSMTVEYLSTESSRTLTPGKQQDHPAAFFQNHRFWRAFSCFASPRNSSASSAILCDRLAKLEIFSPRSKARLVVSASWSMTPAAPAPAVGLARDEAPAELPAAGGRGCTLAAAAVRPRLRSRRSPSRSLGQLETQERRVFTSRVKREPNMPVLELWVGVLVSISSWKLGGNAVEGHQKQ